MALSLVMKSICLVVIAAHSFRGTYATQLAGSPYVNACAYVECQNGGRCYTVGGDAAVCSCPLGFTGQSCEVKEDPCLHYQCQNGGTCQSPEDIPKCICPRGFTGEWCEHTEDPCLRYQCYNGGTCQSPESNPVCVCAPGFTGKQCNSTIIGLDACAGVVCQNWGICRSIGDAAVCSCPPAFTGQLCEVKEDPCLNYQCENGGTCQTPEGHPVCICPPGYSGNKCIFKDGKACANVECQNGGTCIVVGKDAVECHCALGFTGFNCEQQLCPTEPCPSGQECVREASSSRSSCRPVTTRAPPATPRIAPLSSYPKKNDAHVAKPLLGILQFIVVANSFFIFFHVM